jgi:cytochrome d ubiquinol oxidase subunit I
VFAVGSARQETPVGSDILVLSRVQFALTVMFHYLFPPLSIGLGTLMAIMEGTFLRTKDPHYHAMTKFWTKVFAVNFAMGVATGIVMEFQFGTNWAAYARYVGDVFGSALAAEGIFAFFLESGFLAVLVFGWDRVSPRMHFLATVMVALGSIFSAVWIIVANSWQHTPVGFEVQGGRAVITDFWAVVFSPSSMHRLIHVLLGAFILGAFFVLSISAFYALRGRHLEFVRRCFKLSLIFAACASVAIGISGHFQACMTARMQPAKLAALEGHFKTGPADLHLFGIPNEETGRVDYGVGIPGGLSFLVHEDFHKPIPGLEEFRPEDRPPVTIPFIGYHLMVGLGTAFIALSFVGLFFLWRGTLLQQRWLLWLFVVAVVGPYLANQAGWVATEVGRQPFVVYPSNASELVRGPDGHVQMEGGLRTADGVSSSKVVTPEQVVGSIVMFSVIYLLLFAVWLYVLNSKIHQGPEDVDVLPPVKTSTEKLLDTAAARLAEPADYSLTMVRREPPATPKTEV